MLYNIKIAIAYVAEKQYLCSEIINHLIIAIMKEKMTKNVNMSSGEMNAEVMLAAFDALLSRNALLIDYYAMWAKRRKLNYGDTIRQQFYVWAGRVEPNKWVLSAFDFSKSHIPHQVWYMVSNKWIDWLKQNLNK